MCFAVTLLHFASISTGLFEIPLEFERTKTIQMLNGNLLCAANYPFLSPEIDFPTPPLMNATLSGVFLLFFLAAGSRILDAEVGPEQRRRISQLSDGLL